MCSSSAASLPPTQQNGDIESNHIGAGKGKDDGSRFLRALRLQSFSCSFLGLIWVLVMLGAIAAFTALVAAIWLTMGFVFVLQLVLVALIAYLAAGGGYKWVYVAIRTAPRDILGLIRYLLFLLRVWTISRQNKSIGQIFRENAKKYPTKVCFVYEDREWTMSELEEFSNKVANLFRSHGYRKGDCVGLMLENRPEFVGIWLGLSKIGVVTALINYNLRQNSLLHSVNVAKCQAFIFSEEFSDAVREVSANMGGIRFFCFCPGEPMFPRNESNERLLIKLLAETSATPPPIEDVGFHDKMLYIYTSGTTGLPKAAVITNARYLFLAGAINYMLWFRQSDRFYSTLPLYHTAGGAMSIGQAVLFGSTVVIKKKFSASSYFTDIDKYQCTVTQYIGEMCRYLLATPRKPQDSSHKLRVAFGNGLRPQIWEEFVKRFNIPQIGEFYGATEGNANIVNIDSTVGAIGFMSRIIPAAYPVSVIRVDQLTGEPIRNSKGLCIVCEPGEPGVFIGKIIPSNPARAYLGYVNEKESEKKIVRDVFTKGDSAFISGDIVVCDKFGYIFFKDRTGDTFRWKGENVSTAEVEGLISNLIDFKDCVIYGVEVPGSEGRAGMAAIVDKEMSVNLNKLAEGLKQSLPAYARPIFIRLIHEIDMTGTYKMKKLDLQKEGFDPMNIRDKLFYMGPNGTFEPLTPDVYRLIENGKIRL